MHTCIPSHGLKRSWHSCPRWVNAGNKNSLSMHNPRRRNVTASVVGLKNGLICKNLTQNGGSQRYYSWGMRKKKKKKKKTTYHAAEPSTGPELLYNYRHHYQQHCLHCYHSSDIDNCHLRYHQQQDQSHSMSPLSVLLSVLSSVLFSFNIIIFIFICSFSVIMAITVCVKSHHFRHCQLLL